MNSISIFEIGNATNGKNNQNVNGKRYVNLVSKPSGNTLTFYPNDSTKEFFDNAKVGDQFACNAKFVTEGNDTNFLNLSDITPLTMGYFKEVIFYRSNGFELLDLATTRSQKEQNQATESTKERKQIIRRAGSGTPVTTTALETELSQLKSDRLQTTDGTMIADLTAKIAAKVAQIKAINPLSQVTV